MSQVLSLFNGSNEPEWPQSLLSTGILGLDEVCLGGLPPESAYLVRGGAGTGKTTLALHFLAAGAAQGESSLFISFDETEPRIRRNAPRSLSLDKVEILDLSPMSSAFTEEESYDVFAPSEIEGEALTDKLRKAVESLEPKRIAIDSITHLLHLAPDAYRYRKQSLALIRYLVDNGATVLFISEAIGQVPDNESSFLSDGIIDLSYTGDIRYLDVMKLRGHSFQAGPHLAVLDRNGMTVHPRSRPSHFSRSFSPDQIGSGIANLDRLVGGGIHRGSTTVISGPTGVGKSSLGLQFMKEAAGRGERSVVLSFEETADSLVHRCRGLNMPIDDMMGSNRLAIHGIEPRTTTVEEVFSLLRQEIDAENTTIIMFDSMSGFRLAVKSEEGLLERLHDLCRYLANMGITVFVIDEIEQLTNSSQVTHEGFSYLVDNAILLRYFTEEGKLARTIGMLKKRMGDFEKTPRRFEVSPYGLDVGKSVDTWTMMGISSNLTKDGNQ